MGTTVSINCHILKEFSCRDFFRTDLLRQHEENFHSLVSNSQISLFYILIMQQIGGFAFQGDDAVFQNVGAVGELKRHEGVLLDQKDCGALFGVDLSQN